MPARTGRPNEWKTEEIERQEGMGNDFAHCQNVISRFTSTC